MTKGTAQRRAAATGAATTEAARPRLAGWAGAGIAGALAALTFANTLGHGFVWDDPISLQRWLPALPTLWAAFFPPQNIPQFPPDYYRPLQLLSYRLDRAVGAGAPWAFHLSVVALHVLATVLVFRTGMRLFAAHGPESPEGVREGWWKAFWAAALFAVHPIHSESVAWMAARPDVMVTCSGLAALLVYGHAGWSAGTRSALAALLVLVGLLCKENAAALLVLIPASPLVAGVAVAAPSPGRRVAAAASSAAPPPAWTHSAFFAAGGLYLVLRVFGISGAATDDTVFPANPVTVVTAALGRYLRLLVVPYPQNAFIADVPMGGPGLALDLGLLGAFAALSWWAWRRERRRLLFALAWLFATLAPSLAVLFKPPTAPLAERYLYLPSVGFCWLFGAFAGTACRSGGAFRPALRVAFATLLAVAGVLTVQRNRVWHDNYSLWADTAAKNPVDGMPLRSLAMATLERGDPATAENLLLQAAKRRNNLRGRYLIFNNLGTIALNRNDDRAAEKYYRQALELQPSPDCLYNLALIQLRRGKDPEVGADAVARDVKLREARGLFERALAANPYDAETHIGLGQAAQALGDRETARRHYERALQLGLPTSTEAEVRRLLGAMS